MSELRKIKDTRLGDILDRHDFNIGLNIDLSFGFSNNIWRYLRVMQRVPQAP